MQAEEIVYDILMELSSIGERNVEIDQNFLDIDWVDKLMEDCAPEIEEDDEG